MILRIRSVVLAALAVLAASPLVAQDGGLGPVCARGDLRFPGAPDEAFAEARRACYTTAQAMESVQPQLGILLAGGSPTLGSATTGGFRLGVLPGVSATARARVVFLRLPDILAGEGGTRPELSESIGLPLPALAGDVSVAVFSGIDRAPTVGGIGSVDLLGGATWLPLSAFDVEGFGAATDDFSLAFGARVGLLRESFTLPSATVSVMRRSLGEVRYGEVCGGPREAGMHDGRFEAGICAGVGDPGEFAFDLTGWSTRGVVGKRLRGLGLAAGIGYDRLESEVDIGFRVDEGYFARAREVMVDSGRWSAFGNLSFTALAATLALEAGWMQGGEAISGFDTTANDFDPTGGTLFGSLGLRLAL